MAQHSLVLGTGSYIKPDPSVPAQSANSTIQSDSTQESVDCKSPCLTPRASILKEQGFSEVMAAHMVTPQHTQPAQFMRQSGPFLQNGAKVIRWTSGHHIWNP